jgi:drug/metabolite transporter (DMT)-like permease
VDPSLTRALLWGLIAYTAYGVGLVAMKHGAADILHPRSLFATPESRRRGAIWLLGALANFGFVLVLSVALKHGHASVVAALNGWALVCVAALSRLFLGERLSNADRGGMVAVVLGVVLVGLFGGAQTAPLAVDGATLIGFVGVVSAATGALVLASWRRGWWMGATALGTAAGVLAGLSIVLQKVVVEPVLADDGVHLGALLPSPWFWLYLVTSNGGFFVLQVAYPFGRAVQVAPAVVSAMILVPVFGGVACFGEALSGPQIAGTASILLGVLLLTAIEKPASPE